MSTFLPYRLTTTPRRVAANVARIVAFAEAPVPLSGPAAGTAPGVVTRVAPPTAPCVGAGGMTTVSGTLSITTGCP